MHNKFTERKFIFENKDTDNILEITNCQRSMCDAIDAAKASIANAGEALSDHTLIDAIMVNGIRKKESIFDEVKTLLATNMLPEANA